MGLNQVTLMGFVGKEVDFKLIGENKSVATFTLATSKSYKIKATGEKKVDTEWHTIEVWNEIANFANTFVKKGNALLVLGELVYKKYTDKNGVNHTQAVVKAKEIQFTAPASGNSDKAEAAKQTEQYAANAAGPIGEHGNAAGPVGTVPSQEFVASVSDDLPF